MCIKPIEDKYISPIVVSLKYIISIGARYAKNIEMLLSVGFLYFRLLSVSLYFFKTKVVINTEIAAIYI